MALDSLKAKLLADPDIRHHYDQITPEFEAARQMIRLRRELNLTQQQLADKSGVKQSQIARIETGKHSPRLATIIGIAAAVGYKVELKLVPSEPNPDDTTLSQ
jgi:transcriptional regulator with XRE-family HTH domain